MASTSRCPGVFSCWLSSSGVVLCWGSRRLGTAPWASSRRALAGLPLPAAVCRGGRPHSIGAWIAALYRPLAVPGPADDLPGRAVDLSAKRVGDLIRQGRVAQLLGVLPQQRLAVPEAHGVDVYAG